MKKIIVHFPADRRAEPVQIKQAGSPYDHWAIMPVAFGLLAFTLWVIWLTMQP